MSALSHEYMNGYLVVEHQLHSQQQPTAYIQSSEHIKISKSYTTISLLPPKQHQHDLYNTRTLKIPNWLRIVSRLYLDFHYQLQPLGTSTADTATVNSETVAAATEAT